MAASEEIRFKIGADTSALSAGFAKAASIAATAGKQIEKKLGLQDAFKASAVALGLSVDKIANKLAEFVSGGSKDDWQAAADAAARTAAIMDESANKRLSIEQQIQNLQMQAEDAARNSSPAPRRNLQGKVGFMDLLNPIKLFQSSETEAEAARRSAESQEKKAIADAKIRALKEAHVQQYREMVKAEEQLEDLGMSSERRHKLLLEDAESLKADRDAAIKANKEWLPLQIAYAQKLISAEQVALQIAREQTAERQKQAAIMDKLQSAGKAAGAAALGKAEARNDALRFTLDEAASGTRGNAEDQKLAKQILADEEMARKLYDAGPNANAGKMFTGYDEKTGDPKFVLKTSKFFADRAEGLRATFDGLKRNEREPFAGVDEKLTEAVDQLKELNAKLESDE